MNRSRFDISQQKRRRCDWWTAALPVKAGSGTRPSSAVWVTPVPLLFCYNGSKRTRGKRCPPTTRPPSLSLGRGVISWLPVHTCVGVHGLQHTEKNWLNVSDHNRPVIFHSVVCLEMQRSDSLGQRSNSIIEYVINVSVPFELRTGCPYIKKSSSNKFDITNRSNVFTRPIKYSRGR